MKIAKVFKRKIKDGHGNIHLSKYYYVDLSYQGKRFQFATKTRSKKRAEEILRKLENRIANDEFNISDIQNRKNVIYFRDLAEEWLEKYSKINNSPSQYETNIFRLNKHILPYFGNNSIKSIDTKMIQDFIAIKKNTDNLKGSTINRLLALMSKIYSDAITWDYVNSNPVARIKRFEENQEEMLYLEKSDVKNFLESCNDNFYPIAATALYTGMRKGEICGLKWDRVSLERKLITVEKSMDGKTKSKKIRHIPINRNLLEIFEKHSEDKNSDYVFSRNKKGEMYKGDFRMSMRNALKKAGIEKRLRFHDLRHTFAANYMMSNGSITSLNKILGHSTLQMTMRYIHFSPEFIEGEIDKLSYD